MNFLSFLLPFLKNISIENKNLKLFDDGDVFFYKEQHCKNDLLYFGDDYSLYQYISEQLANYYYLNYEAIQDKKSSFPEKQTLPDSQKLTFKLIRLDKIGIKKIAIRHHDRTAYLIYYENIPDYERGMIDIFIWKNCIDYVIDRLSKKTIYNIYKINLQGTSVQSIETDFRFAHISNTEQLKRYIEFYEFNKLFLFEKLLDSEIIIDKSIINIPIKEIPNQIEMKVALNRYKHYNSSVCNKSKYVVKTIRFQILINNNLSLLIKPHPYDITNIIDEQCNLWNKGLYHNFLFDDTNYLVPKEMIKIVKYLKKHNVETRFFGHILDVYNLKESIKKGKEYDENIRNFIRENYNPNDGFSYYEFIENEQLPPFSYELQLKEGRILVVTDNEE